MDLSEDNQDYNKAKKKIIARFVPISFVLLDDFNARRLRPEESLPVFVRSLKRLLGKAMPDVEDGTRKQLLRHQFLVGLPAAVSIKRLLGQAMPDVKEGTRKQLFRHQFLMGLPAAVSKQLRATLEIDDLEKMVDWAKLVLTLDHKERAATVGSLMPSSDVVLLQQQVAALTSGRAPTNSTTSRHCYWCHQPGHVQRNCPLSRRRCFACGRQGHLTKDCRHETGKGCLRRGGGIPITVSPHLTVVTAARSSATTVQGRVGDTEVEVMLDSGASVSLVWEDTANAVAGITTGK